MTDFSNKVVYQIYPKSFRDTNGDGFGDIPGIIEKLDYLQELGVDYLWLTPFFPSPQNDNGYDVSDYCAVDARFGTMEDLEELIRQGKKRGIGLMLDMVFNHTSTEHVWFQKALQGEEKYQKYYIFREGIPDKAPTNWQSKFGGSAWEYVPALKKMVSQAVRCDAGRFKLGSSRSPRRIKKHSQILERERHSGISF